MVTFCLAGCLAFRPAARRPRARGYLLGRLGAVSGDIEAQSNLDTLQQNVIASSAIEGERLNVGSVCSSPIDLGLAEETRPTARSEGLARLSFDTIDSTRRRLS